MPFPKPILILPTRVLHVPIDYESQKVELVRLTINARYELVGDDAEWFNRHVCRDEPALMNGYPIEWSEND